MHLTASTKHRKKVCTYEKMCTHKKGALNNPSLRYVTRFAKNRHVARTRKWRNARFLVAQVGYCQVQFLSYSYQRTFLLLPSHTEGRCKLPRQNKPLLTGPRGVARILGKGVLSMRAQMLATRTYEMERSKFELSRRTRSDVTVDFARV